MIPQMAAIVDAVLEAISDDVMTVLATAQSQKIRFSSITQLATTIIIMIIERVVVRLFFFECHRERCYRYVFKPLSENRHD